MQDQQLPTPLTCQQSATSPFGSWDGLNYLNDIDTNFSWKDILE